MKVVYDALPIVACDHVTRVTVRPSKWSHPSRGLGKCVVMRLGERMLSAAAMLGTPPSACVAFHEKGDP